MLVGYGVGAPALNVGTAVMGALVGAVGLLVGVKTGTLVGAKGVAVGAIGMLVGMLEGKDVGFMMGFLVGICVGNIGSLSGVVGIADGWPDVGLFVGFAERGAAEGVIDSAAFAVPSATSVLCILA